MAHEAEREESELGGGGVQGGDGDVDGVLGGCILYQSQYLRGGS